MKGKSIYSFIFTCLKPYKWLIFIQFIISIIYAFDVSLRPYLIKYMLDVIATIEYENAVHSLMWPALAYIGLSILMVLSFRIFDYIWLHLNPNLKTSVGRELMNRMMDHSHRLYQNHFAGSLGTKIKDVMSSIPDLIRIGINQFFAHILAVIIATFTMWQTSPRFAIALLVWLSVFVWGNFHFAKTAKRLSHDAADIRSKLVGHIVDTLSNIMNVRFFSGKKTEMIRLEGVLKNYLNADQKRDWFFLKIFALQGFSFLIYEALCIYWLVTGLKSLDVSPGDFALVLTLNVSIVEFLWNLSKDVGDFSKALGDITQGLVITQSPIDIEDKPKALPLKVSQGEINFSNVTFHYQHPSALFTNLNVTIPAGQKVGLVGYSGSGKTTFVNLLLRLYDINQGSIKIDGQDIRDVTQDSLRKAIAVIPQEPLLFHRTLMDNIRYGRMGASEADVIDASKKAFADGFIRQLPEGYQGLVGERGVKLSGGQRQRIAIARAILKNAPILILDEATSQLDSLTEQDIQHSIEDLMRHKTTLVIAHRLSTLLNMERILVFEQGRIVEDGTARELFEKNGLFRTLWEAQVGDFLPTHLGEIPEDGLVQG
jgi:ATP-binding cassette, subfamily B, bacterial